MQGAYESSFILQFLLKLFFKEQICWPHISVFLVAEISFNTFCIHIIHILTYLYINWQQLVQGSVALSGRLRLCKFMYGLCTHAHIYVSIMHSRTHVPAYTCTHTLTRTHTHTASFWQVHTTVCTNVLVCVRVTWYWCVRERARVCVCVWERESVCTFCWFSLSSQQYTLSHAQTHTCACFLCFCVYFVVYISLCWLCIMTRLLLFISVSLTL